MEALPSHLHEEVTFASLGVMKTGVSHLVPARVDSVFMGRDCRAPASTGRAGSCSV